MKGIGTLLINNCWLERSITFEEKGGGGWGVNDKGIDILFLFQNATDELYEKENGDITINNK